MVSPHHRGLSERSELTHDVHEFDVNIDTREIFLHRWDDDDDGETVDFGTAAKLIKNLRLIQALNPRNSPLLIHMSNDGGDNSHGMAIYDGIQFCESHVTILGYGDICSMGTIILQAADTRVLMPNVIFMVHYGQFGISENSLAGLAHAEYLKTFLKKILDVYAERCVKGKYFRERKMSKTRVRSFIDRKLKDKGDWFLTAAEAVEYGFADGVLGYKGFDSIKSLQDS